MRQIHHPVALRKLMLVYDYDPAPAPLRDAPQLPRYGASIVCGYADVIFGTPETVTRLHAVHAL